MRVLLCALAVTGLSIACSAQAKDTPTEPGEKVVCKRVYDADLGSHFTSSKRICHTAAEWKEIEDGDARALKSLRDHGGISPPAPSMGATPM
jgi:hypothetical protein